MVVDNRETSPSLLELRYRSGRGQTNLNIELGLSNQQSYAGDGVSQTSPATGIQPGNSIISQAGGGGGRAGGLCFLGDTIIGLDHLQKPIETATAGEPTQAFRGSEQGICEIKNVMWGWTQDVLRIVLLTNLDKRRIVLWPKPNHRFYTGNGEFVEIDKFIEGDWIKADDLGFAARLIEKHRVHFAAPVKAWNLTTEWGTYWAGSCPVSNLKAPELS